MSQAETRAEFAERSVAKLEKTIDDLEGIQHSLVLSLLGLPPSALTRMLTLLDKYVTVTQSFATFTSAVGTRLVPGWVLVLWLTDEAINDWKDQSHLSLMPCISLIMQLQY